MHTQFGNNKQEVKGFQEQRHLQYVPHNSLLNLERTVFRTSYDRNSENYNLQVIELVCSNSTKVGEEKAPQLENKDKTRDGGGWGLWEEKGKGKGGRRRRRGTNSPKGDHHHLLEPSPLPTMQSSLRQLHQKLYV